MRFRVVRVFDRITSATDNVAYRLETVEKMTQGEAIALMDALNTLSPANLALLKNIAKQIAEELDSGLSV